jgi:hypothetical protein
LKRVAVIGLNTPECMINNPLSICLKRNVFNDFMVINIEKEDPIGETRQASTQALFQRDILW